MSITLRSPLSLQDRIARVRMSIESNPEHRVLVTNLTPESLFDQSIANTVDFCDWSQSWSQTWPQTVLASGAS